MNEASDTRKLFIFHVMIGLVLIKYSFARMSGSAWQQICVFKQTHEQAALVRCTRLMVFGWTIYINEAIRSPRMDEHVDDFAVSKVVFTIWK